MLFLKKDLIGQYDWTNEDGSSIYTGSPSRRIFDRFNGNQVLFIINLYSRLFGITAIEDVRRMETLILNHLPMETKSEISVFKWLGEIFATAPKEQ